MSELCEYCEDEYILPDEDHCDSPRCKYISEHWDETVPYCSKRYIGYSYDLSMELWGSPPK